MTTNVPLAEKLFSAEGFLLTFVDFETGDLRFFKPFCDESGLFETIAISLAGRKLQTASADVGISCVRGRFSWRGLSERFCVLDVAADKERGETDLITAHEAELWLRRLVDVLPTQLACARERLAPVVDQRTSEARAACRQYLGALGSPCSVEDATRKLLSRASEEQSVDANLMLSHEIGWLANPAYHYAAALAVLSLWQQVEPHAKFDFEDPSRDTPLMWRIQIIADHLMAYPRPMTLVFPRHGGPLDYSFRQPLVT